MTDGTLTFQFTPEMRAEVGKALDSVSRIAAKLRKVSMHNVKINTMMVSNLMLLMITQANKFLAYVDESLP